MDVEWFGGGGDGLFFEFTFFLPSNPLVTLAVVFFKKKYVVVPRVLPRALRLFWMWPDISTRLMLSLPLKRVLTNLLVNIKWHLSH